MRDNIRFATIDLKSSEHELYYNGYCNSTLWPLFHYFPERLKHEQQQYEAYHAVNALFARQLLDAARAERCRMGTRLSPHSARAPAAAAQFTGPIGFFLHMPFPHIQVLRVLPNHAELVRDLCQYDLVGFQTDDDVRSFYSCIEQTAPAAWQSKGDQIEVGGRTVRVGAYPIGVDVEAVAAEAAVAIARNRCSGMIASLIGRKLIIGVDRLDYSKGLTERFAAFEHFLESFPDNQGHVTFLQIAPLSRADVLAYSEIRQALEQTAGRLNGRFAEADWTPIRYLNRNFSHSTLDGLSARGAGGSGHPGARRHESGRQGIRRRTGSDDPGVLIFADGRCGARTERCAAGEPL